MTNLKTFFTDTLEFISKFHMAKKSWGKYFPFYRTTWSTRERGTLYDRMGNVVDCEVLSNVVAITNKNTVW